MTNAIGRLFVVLAMLVAFVDVSAAQTSKPVATQPMIFKSAEDVLKLVPEKDLPVTKAGWEDSATADAKPALDEKLVGARVEVVLKLDKLEHDNGKSWQVAASPTKMTTAGKKSLKVIIFQFSTILKADAEQVKDFHKGDPVKLIGIVDGYGLFNVPRKDENIPCFAVTLRNAKLIAQAR